MLEILPDRINTQATFYINPNGPASTDDFLYPEYPIKASMSMEIPLSFMAENLTLTDTNEISMSDQDNIEIETLYIIIENGFPLDAEIQIILLDQENLIIDTLMYNSLILAATVNENNEVSKSTISTIEMNDVTLEEAAKLITISSFSTQSINEFIKIYNDYQMGITISARIRKTLGE